MPFQTEQQAKEEKATIQKAANVNETNEDANSQWRTTQHPTCKV